ncbi:class I SAM-dependent RNA methyltransferase [Bifidobacterium panos]|uniref:RNA methyltransferase n=1 Tax=Bifidobacterium panos TaxID=2675321 RepID=A0ABX1T049_9BIFI|nr:RsmD family RNA methyltransferase [Bifidobacterium sp. DSM 109963]NMN02204.1 RNA methyltransferase [Bifidobacterium sp. DSM 109963]
MQAEVRIERYADQGRCVAHIDGRVVFVRFALPGELVRIALDEPHDRDERFWTGEVIEVLEASEDRVEPAWPMAGPVAFGGGVGGADLVHVSLPGQIKWKAVTVSEQMSRLGHVDVTVPVERVPGDEESKGFNWRTRIEMIADEEGRPSMRRRGTHVRVPIDTMPLATRTLLGVADANHVWSGGFEPGSQIRLSVPEPRSSAPNNPSNYAILVNGEIIAGSRQLTEQATVAGHEFTYTVDANGFWQMHREAPVMLANHVIDLVRDELQGAVSAVIWDLYSGSGLFTLPLAALAAKRTHMLSVEGGSVAVKSQQRNLRALGLNDVDVRCSDVARALTRVPAHLSRPDVVVLDPPRAGAHAKVCRQIAAAGPRSIIYIACDPASLARDTATLAELGYTLADIRAYDIYPMTHHVETVALFRLA